MRSKIKLEYPYNQDWDIGYLGRNRENRDTLYLYKKPKDNTQAKRSTTQYSRYLMSVKLGRYLDNKEHVDHIDGNKNNNDLLNLQILSLAENSRKEFKKEDIHLVCPICQCHFSKTATELRGRKHRIENNLIACSRKCGGKLSHIIKNIK